MKCLDLKKILYVFKPCSLGTSSLNNFTILKLVRLANSAIRETSKCIKGFMGRQVRLQRVARLNWHRLYAVEKSVYRKQVLITFYGEFFATVFACKSVLVMNNQKPKVVAS